MRRAFWFVVGQVTSVLVGIHLLGWDGRIENPVFGYVAWVVALMWCVAAPFANWLDGGVLDVHANRMKRESEGRRGV